MQEERQTKVAAVKYSELIVKNNHLTYFVLCPLLFGITNL